MQEEKDMFNGFVLPELVEKAKNIIERKGEEGIIDSTYIPFECGCMGPSGTNKLCPCRQSMALQTNKVEIVAQFDEALAKKIWLSKFVASLPG